MHQAALESIVSVQVSNQLSILQDILDSHHVCIESGMLYTPMIYKPGLSPEVREARRNRSLLKTEGNGWDCGCAVRFLASDEARWMTGVALPVDAGSTAAPAGDGMGQGMSSTLAGGAENA